MQIHVHARTSWSPLAVSFSLRLSPCRLTSTCTSALLGPPSADRGALVSPRGVLGRTRSARTTPRPDLGHAALDVDVARARAPETLGACFACLGRRILG
jgi:hypothetical protein